MLSLRAIKPEIMQKLSTSQLRLGIVAGGQLGKMLIQEASKWDIETFVLDNDPTCPAKSIASHYFQGNHLDYDALLNLGRNVDILTYELENVNLKALKTLKNEGIVVKPDPEILEIIQDKGLQKLFFEQHNIPTAPFKLYENGSGIISAIEAQELSLPFVQKLLRGGYDGRGVCVIQDRDDLKQLFDKPSVVEQKIDIAKEIAILVARNQEGETRCYQPVEMVFDPKANLLDRLFSPALISNEIKKQLFELSEKIAHQLQYEGVLAIEYFLGTDNQIYVNEMAPRPHNSGHHTIESAATSQFEQHLRGILNLPLGSTQLLKPAVMVNILGNPGYEGHVKYIGLDQIFAIEGSYVHLYGKKITKPYRKMGHITILGENLEEALSKADEVKFKLKVISD
mgnify:CR=1 FL=1